VFVPAVALAGLSGLSQSTAQVQQMVVTAAAPYESVAPGITSIALGVAAHESGFQATAQNPGSSAAGVMQLLSVTQKTLGVTNPLDAQQNVNAGVALLAQLYQAYGNWTTALYAYADGSGAVNSPGYQPSAMAVQFASSVQSGTVNGFSISSILDDLGISSAPASSDESDSGDTLLGLSTDSATSSAFAQSLGVSDAELVIGGAAVLGALGLAVALS
jgi:Transglycosylase SLT domain